MNGIAPFWSARSLIGFLIAPVSPGLLAGLMAMFNFPAGGVNVSAVLFVLTLSILGAAIVGYPIALLTAAPLYYFVFRRMTRVRYRHFFIYGLALAVLFGLAGQSGFILDGPDRREDFKFVSAVILFGILTIFACSVFYLIVRQPEIRGTDADTADD
jgi:hypothetical protein